MQQNPKCRLVTRRGDGGKLCTPEGSALARWFPPQYSPSLDGGGVRLCGGGVDEAMWNAFIGLIEEGYIDDDKSC